MTKRSKNSHHNKNFGLVQNDSNYLRNAVLAIFSVLLMSCEKEELPVPAHDPGNVITNNVQMESDYRYQLFFDLETNTMVKKTFKKIWDLGFEASEYGYRVILNSAKAMFIANTHQADFFAVSDTVGLNFRWDAISGNLDSTAIDDWRGTNDVYVIDRGFDEAGLHQGFSKIVLLSVASDEYLVKFSNLDGTNEMSLTIAKNDSFNFSFLSLDGNIVSAQPEKGGWDLVFSQYTHVFEGNPPTPYLVTGCLSNRNKVEVAAVFDKDFDSITLDDKESYSFYSEINSIGYNWKEYSFSTGSYTIFIDKNYIIKSTEEKYYKFHFIDFYDALGAKGNPTFEFQEL